MVRASFGPTDRLRTKRDFDHVFARPRRVTAGPLLLLARNNTQAKPRLGLAVSKRVDKRATRRNRLKRLIRESFRLHREELPAVDMVVIPRRGSGELDNGELHALLERLWRRLASAARREDQN